MRSSLVLGTLNIYSGTNSRLQMAMRCMEKMSVDIGILTETKITNDMYAKESEGYEIVCTKARSAHQGGVALFYRKYSWKFSVEGTKTFGPNVIRAVLVSGRKRWNVIGAYIPPSETDGSTLQYIEEARRTAPDHRPTILLGDFNAVLDNPRSQYEADLADFAGTFDLTDLRCHFCLREKAGGDWTWRQRRTDHLVQRRLDYILTDTRSDFSKFNIVTPKWIDTDHRMVKTVLRLDSKGRHRKYMKRRKRYPFRSPVGEKSKADEIFASLQNKKEKREKINSRSRSWISSATWNLIDEKCRVRRMGINGDVLAQLKKDIRRSLKNDRRARADAAATAAESLLARGKVEEAYSSIKGWYKVASGRPPKPDFRDAAETRAEYETLFTDMPPSGNPIPLCMEKFQINDDPPSEDEVVTALKSLKNRKAPGASGIRVEDLKRWYHNAHPEDGDPLPSDEDVATWEELLELVNLAFETGEMPQAFCNGVLVLIPKSNPGEYRGIALLEPLYKLVSAIINNRLKASIVFRDAVHGFRTGRGTGTALIEAKLRMQLTERGNKPLYMVFLDLKKAYDTLDRPSTIRILRGYGVGDALIRIIENIWNGDTMVPKQAGYFGTPFRAKRGVRQGDILSPMIFNLLVDAIICHIENLGVKNIQFYADDGLLWGEDGTVVQSQLDIINTSFASFGLKMNANKTEFLVMTGRMPTVTLSDRAIERRYGGNGTTYAEWANEKVACPLCGQEVVRCQLRRHQDSNRCQGTGDENTASADQQPPSLISSAALISSPLEGPPRTYEFNMLGGGALSSCPVEGCSFNAQLKSAMNRHFRERHPRDTIRFDGNEPHQCEICDTKLLTAGGLARHRNTATCQRAAKRKENLDRRTDQQATVDFILRVDGIPIKRVKEFKYLGRMVSDNDNDAPAIRRNIKRARAQWGRFSRLLRREHADTAAMSTFYKVIVLNVLLYGSETWVISDIMWQELTSFHHRCARYVVNRHGEQDEDDIWKYPPSAEVLTEANLLPVEAYIQHRKNTIMTFARTRPIYQEALRSSPIQGNGRQTVWWNQVHFSEHTQ